MPTVPTLVFGANCAYVGIWRDFRRSWRSWTVGVVGAVGVGEITIFPVDKSIPMVVLSSNALLVLARQTCMHPGID